MSFAVTVGRLRLVVSVAQLRANWLSHAAGASQFVEEEPPVRA